jgi:peroxiredoxin
VIPVFLQKTKKQNIMSRIISFVLTHVVLLIVAPSLLFAQGKHVVVGGKIDQCQSKTASLFLSSGDTKLIAESMVDSAGSFRLEARLDKGDVFKLQFEGGVYLSLVIMPGDQIEVTANMADLLNTLQIKGSDQSQMIYESNRVLQKYKSQLDSINNRYYSLLQQGLTDSVKQVLISSYMQTDSAQNQYLVNLISQHPDYLSCLFIIDKLPIEKYFDSYVLLDEGLSKKFSDNNFVINFHKRVENTKKLADGSPAPEISLPDPDGKTITLSSFKGKVVLIDFWASWCSPCRKENPNMVRIYNKYNAKGFEILGVSLDKTRDAWVKAIADDKLTWAHCSDLKFWQSEAALTYNVSAVPYTVLIDREGKIIAKGLRGEELEARLEQLFSN